MEREQEIPGDIIELGAASVETKGFDGGDLDFPAGQGQAGILDD